MLHVGGAPDSDHTGAVRRTLRGEAGRPSAGDSALRSTRHHRDDGHRLRARLGASGARRHSRFLSRLFIQHLRDAGTQVALLRAGWNRRPVSILAAWARRPSPLLWRAAVTQHGGRVSESGFTGGGRGGARPFPGCVGPKAGETTRLFFRAPRGGAPTPVGGAGPREE